MRLFLLVHSASTLLPCVGRRGLIQPLEVLEAALELGLVRSAHTLNAPRAHRVVEDLDLIRATILTGDWLDCVPGTHIVTGAGAFFDNRVVIDELDH